MTPVDKIAAALDWRDAEIHKSMRNYYSPYQTSLQRDMVEFRPLYVLIDGFVVDVLQERGCYCIKVDRAWHDGMDMDEMGTDVECWFPERDGVDYSPFEKYNVSDFVEIVGFIVDVPGPKEVLHMTDCEIVKRRIAKGVPMSIGGFGGGGCGGVGASGFVNVGSSGGVYVEVA